MEENSSLPREVWLADQLSKLKTSPPLSDGFVPGVAVGVVKSLLDNELDLCKSFISRLELVSPFARKRILEFVSTWFNEKNTNP